VRGSESEDEVRVDAPKRHLASAIEAIDYGYECAILWIDAQDHRLEHGILKNRTPTQPSWRLSDL